MNTTNKNLNRRALPKFLLWVGIGALVGFCAGLASGILGGLNAEEWVSVRLPAALGAVAPWGIPVTSAILLGVCLGQYRAAKKLCDSWDGEDETAPDQADQRLNIVLLCSSLAMILDFLFLGMGVLYTEGVATAAVTVAEMLVSCALVVLAQQKTVDLTRRMNPEKQVSAYDSKFQEKWYEVCDEAERAQIGRASYRAFRAVNRFCPFLWLALLLLSYVFPIGLMPLAAVLLVWAVLEVTYILECIRLSRNKEAAQ
ncbi:MAG TPA: DUF3169 family protein [Candidatus Oscillibacter excrementigallinarum]|uniref:DUF3169 family protein n=2 Tax=Oscillospiraceae TaxID=216572 RepID=A0A9D2LK09_9FIRM|nr:DUF3169 family protein [Candidatus Oscillibacter excrementigallinarum]